MTIMLDDFQEISRMVEKAKTIIAEKKGARKQIKSRIKNEFNCKNIKVAEKKLKSLLKQETEIASTYIPKKKRFETKWAKQLKRLRAK